MPVTTQESQKNIQSFLSAGGTQEQLAGYNYGPKLNPTELNAMMAKYNLTPQPAINGATLVQAVTQPASPYNYGDPYGAYASIGAKLGLNEATAGEQAAQKALLDYQNTTQAQINKLRNNRDLSTGLEAGFEAMRVREATQEEANLGNQLTLAQNKRLAIENQVGQQYDIFKNELSTRENLLAQAAQYGMKNVNINMGIDELSRAVGVGKVMQENPKAGIKEGDSWDVINEKIQVQEDKALIRELKIQNPKAKIKSSMSLDEALKAVSKAMDKAELKSIANSLGISTKGSSNEISKRIQKYYKEERSYTKEKRALEFESARLDIANTKDIMAKRKSGGGMSKSEIKEATRQEGITGIQSGFERIKGEDGYVNPKNYVEAKRQWVINGFKKDDFDDIFEMYQNPKDIYK